MSVRLRNLLLKGMTGFASAFILAVCSLHADVKMPNIFGSNMVLQRDSELPVWGWASPGETVTVSIGDNKATAVADAKGEWKLKLAPIKAGGPYVMEIKGNNTISLNNVLVGEVWLCSGQSNMEMGINACFDAETEVPAATNQSIRLFKIPKKFSALPQTNVDASWKVCSPESVAAGGWKGFSAAGYYFGKELNAALNVPVGLIDSAWGGTRIEPWTPPEGFASVPALAKIYEQVQLSDPRTDLHKQRAEKLFAETAAWVNESKKAVSSESLVPLMPKFPDEFLPPKDQQVPVVLYNGMLNPVVPFKIKGAIWYQGESNHGEGKLYTEKTKALVEGWRKVWNNPDLFYFYVQIAPYQYGNESPYIVPEFWEAQTAAQAIPGTGMIVTTDISDLKDIHPRNKKEVGRRLSLLALNKAYGKKDIVCNGPSFKEMKIEGNKLKIVFDNAEGGLKTRDGKAPDWFEIIDAEKGGFVKADAVIDGNAVVLSSAEVSNPIAVRYGWHKLAEPNLANQAGLPALTFRAGNVPNRDQLVFIPETKDYQLVYDLDLSKLGASFKYDVDKSAEVTRSFDRIAYMIELTQGGKSKYLYVSMDAFTNDVKKIGVPVLASQAVFQTMLNNLNVYSDAEGIKTGTGMKGNIEFWPNNYGGNNAKNIPNATNAYDWGDQIDSLADGYGSMQIHNYDAKQTLFAINNWKATQNADIGIGNTPSAQHTDWTFSQSGKNYEKKRLRVFVKQQ